jgi:hypothetical protein
MTILNLCDQKIDYLQTNGFQLVLPRFPNTAFFSQTFIFPEVAIPSPKIGTPFVPIPLAGDTPIFSPMQFSFIVDSKMKNYREIFNWVNGIGYSEDYQDFVSYDNKDDIQRLGEQDAQVHILSAKSNILGTWTFKDAIPIALGGFELNVVDENTSYVTVQATFEYRNLEFKLI